MSNFATFYHIQVHVHWINFWNNGTLHLQKDAFPMSELYYEHVAWNSRSLPNVISSLYTSIEDLRGAVDFPSHQDFFSKLKQSNISIEMYNEAKQLYETRLALPEGHSNKWNNMSDYLKYYNLLDVQPLTDALRTCFQNYMKYFHVDGLSKLSLPSIGFHSMYQLFDQNLPYVFSFNRIGDGVRRLFRDNVMGGLSTVFHRLVHV